MTIRRTGFGILLLALASIPALAQGGDPPSRVARLNYLSGPVSFRPGSAAASKLSRSIQITAGLLAHNQQAELAASPASV